MKKLVAWVKAHVAPARKALVAVAALAAQVIALGVLHGTALHYVQVGLAALAAVGVYAVPNAKKPLALAEVSSALKTMSDAGKSAVEATKQLADTVTKVADATPAAPASPKPDAAK